MYKILIVDDEYEMRNGLTNYFPWADIGFEIAATAENGLQALELLWELDVDVLLCDIIMPVMSGMELLAQIRKSKLKTKIIFFSAHSEFSYAQEALELGASAYILKATKHNELIRIFSKLKSELDEERCAPGHDAAQFPEGELNHSEKIITAIKDYVEVHYRDVTLEDLTGVVHMNPDYISRYFKKYANINFSDYLMEVRMIKAAELLGDIRYKIYEVSDMVGYTNSFNFTRAFKNYFKMTPKEYKNSRNKNDIKARDN